jgi:hypothetical protein
MPIIPATCKRWRWEDHISSTVWSKVNYLPLSKNKLGIVVNACNPSGAGAVGRRIMI